MVEDGKSSYQISEETQKGQSTVAYWLRKFGLKTVHFPIYDSRCIKKGVYRGGRKAGCGNKNSKNEDEFFAAIQEYYNLGHSYNDCIEHFGTYAGKIAKGVRAGKIKTRSMADGIRLFLSKETPEHKSDRVLKIKAGFAKSTKQFGGYKKNAGRGKHYNVIDSFGKPAHLQSSYEFQMTEVLNAMGVKWERPSFFYYLDGMKTKKYFPDFFLPEHDVYLDTKNDYLMKIDARKIALVLAQPAINLHVLRQCQINKEHIQSILMAQ